MFAENLRDLSDKTPWEQALFFFPPEIRQILGAVAPQVGAGALEIRLRIHQALEVNLGHKTVFLTPGGAAVPDAKQAYIIGAEEFRKTVNSLTAGSLYAWEEELVNGYLTLPGGHRVGFTGHVIQNGGKIQFIRHLSSLNFRIARQVKGIAGPLLPFLWERGRFLKTMILGPPASGKTTLLRDIAREVSRGVPELGIAGLHVGIVDERAEIAGCFHGAPQMELGPRADVLDGCSKKEGVYLLLRSMNPQLIITDEIGSLDDWPIIEDILNAGVSFIASAHAQDPEEASRRPGLRRILESGVIERLVILSNRRRIGGVESIRAGWRGPVLSSAGAEEAVKW